MKIGEVVELSLTGRLVGIEEKDSLASLAYFYKQKQRNLPYDEYEPSRLLYKVRICDERGIFLCDAIVIEEMIVRPGGAA